MWVLEMTHQSSKCSSLLGHLPAPCRCVLKLWQTLRVTLVRAALPVCSSLDDGKYSLRESTKPLWVPQACLACSALPSLRMVASVKVGSQTPPRIQRNVTMDGAWLVGLFLECSVPKGNHDGLWKINLDRTSCSFHLLSHSS